MDLRIITIFVFIVAFILGIVVVKILKHFSIIKAGSQAEDIIDDAKKKAINIAKDAKFEAKTEAYEYKMKAEQEIKVRRQEISELESNLSKKEQNIDKKELMVSGRQELLMSKEEELEKRNAKLKRDEEDLESKKKEQIDLLENISGYSKSEAKEELVSQVKSQIQNEMSALIRDAEEEAKEKAEGTAKNLVAIAIQRYSAEQANERTISTVALPSEDMKGRIIGREGRNIRAIEAATGVDLIIDDTPEAITVSCFDPIRREIAKQALEALIQDGRIQPTRIEELVKKAQSNVDKSI
ncbi:MAG: Rnase Y domain-containing protein, partial [Erysipelotrichales bacterium]